jgi:hypothetical protein
MTEKTYEEVERIVREIDPGVEVGSDSFKTAALLVSSLVVGQQVRELVRFTGQPREWVAERVDRWKAAGIFRRGKFACEWFEEGGAAMFWCDVLVGQGVLERQAA